MSGRINGVQAVIREKAPSAAYVHRASHCLNLVLNRSCEVIPIRNTFAVVVDVINFINDSPKRRAFFQANLTTLCETRFVQRHDAL